MIPPDPLLAYQNAPLGDLLAILLRQFRRPLKGHGVDLTDAEAESLAHDLAAQAPATGASLSEKAQAVRAALVDLVAESETVLAGWNLTFQQSLDTEMNDISGWESTAEFLEIANEKANAELRISTGASLLAALGDLRSSDDLLFLVARGEDDLDAVIARRVLLFASAIEASDPQWLEHLRAWIHK